MRDVHPDRAAAELHSDDRALGPEEVRALTNDLGIVPREVTQRRGDAMFVPAGCVAQATTTASHVAVSVACLAHASLPAALRATRVARRVRGAERGAEWGAEWKAAFRADARAVVASAAASVKERRAETSGADGRERTGGGGVDSRERTGGVAGRKTKT